MFGPQQIIKYLQNTKTQAPLEDILIIYTIKYTDLYSKLLILNESLFLSTLKLHVDLHLKITKKNSI